MYIKRTINSAIIKSLNHFPVIAILGPRQVGKTTLAKKIIKKFTHSIYLDLELDSDLSKLSDPEYYLKKYENSLVCIDEIQRKPEIFPLLRALVDQKRRPARYLILGSTSEELLKQSSETLAGRIVFHELTPFRHSEIRIDQIENHRLRGGFPDSFLASDESISMLWRKNFVKTFLERDLGQLGYKMNSIQLRRFWTMLAHSHGQVLNKTKLGQAMGIDAGTCQRWIDILEKTYMIRILPTNTSNTKKRIIKSPKVYIRDSGIFHQLLSINDYDELISNPNNGQSWEGYGIENILSALPHWTASFYRNSNSAEIDLILEYKTVKLGIDFKVSRSTKITKGSYTAMDDMKLDKFHIITPHGDKEIISPRIQYDSIYTFSEEMQNKGQSLFF